MGWSEQEFYGPLRCYNAYNHWKLGWFQDRVMELWHFYRPRLIELESFVDYGRSNIAIAPNEIPMEPRASTIPVLINVRDAYFLQYNLAERHNAGTPLYRNAVTVVEKKAEGKTEIIDGIYFSDPERQHVLELDNYLPGQKLIIEICDVLISNTTTNKVILSIGADESICDVYDDEGAKALDYGTGTDSFRIPAGGGSGVASGPTESPMSFSSSPDGDNSSGDELKSEHHTGTDSFQQNGNAEHGKEEETSIRTGTDSFQQNVNLEQDDEEEALVLTGTDSFQQNITSAEENENALIRTGGDSFRHDSNVEEEALLFQTGLPSMHSAMTVRKTTNAPVDRDYEEAIIKTGHPSITATATATQTTSVPSLASTGPTFTSYVSSGSSIGDDDPIPLYEAHSRGVYSKRWDIAEIVDAADANFAPTRKAAGRGDD